MKKILVIGASGMLAKPVVRELISSGFDVTVAARNAEKLKELFPGTKAISVDVFDKPALAAAMKGQEILYINLAVGQTAKESDPQPEGEGITNLIEAAKQNGVRRLAYLSSLIMEYEGMNGFHWWAFQIKKEAVEKIKNSRIPYSIFYPSTFMETVPGNMIRGNRLMMASGSAAKMWFIAAKDYAKQLIKALQIAGEQNQEYTIQGLSGYDWNQAADIFVKNYKKPLKIMRAPVGMVKFIANFNRKAKYGWRIMEALNKYPEKFVSEKTWQELGEPTIKLEEFVAGLG